MKKYDLLKILGISLFITLILSWIIPAGAYTSGVFQGLNKTAPLGVYDLFRTPVVTIATFIQYGVVFLAIGGFYGVLNKTGAYSKIVNSVKCNWTYNRKAFLVLTMLLFLLLSTLSGLPAVLFVLVPFFVTMLLSLGYSKITTFAATVGAILVGQIGCVLGFNLWGYLAVFFDIGMTSIIAARIILFLIVTIIFVVLVIKKSSKDSIVKEIKNCSKCNDPITEGEKFCQICGTEYKEKKNKDEKKAVVKIEIPLYEEHEAKKSSLPLVIILIAMVTILLVGMYNWYYAFELSTFTNIHETITTFKIGEYPIFANLLGSVSEFGFFGNYDLAAILLLASALLGWIYNVKFNEIINGFREGMKKIFPTAMYAMLASIIFAAILNMQAGNFVATIVDKLMSMTASFNLFTTTASSIVASLFYNDFYTLANTYYGVFATFDAAILPVASLLMQSIFALIMVIAPTSVFLIAGLRFLEIPYKNWLKYIWKFILIIFAIIILLAFILSILL